jgi:chorismate synthase
LRGNSFGSLFTVTSFGESHGEALGVVIDGIPANLQVDLTKLQEILDKRRPGRLKISTSRNEADTAEILSGVFEDKTIGTPICVIVRNTNQRSADYKELKNQYRPGHADLTTEKKFGHRDHRGGGRASGRETLSRVIAGYFAGLIIPQISFKALITEVGPFTEKTKEFDSNLVSEIGYIDSAKDQEIKKYLLDLKEKGDSIGGSVHLKITGCPAGLGEPVFAKLKAELSQAMLSIGSCMGVTFGRGFDFAHLHGSEISNESKNFSGIEGGISNGEEIYLDLVFKAPSTIGKKALEGRHDPCILPRVLPVIESMAKIVIADQLLRQNAFQLN